MVDSPSGFGNTAYKPDHNRVSCGVEFTGTSGAVVPLKSHGRQRSRGYLLTCGQLTQRVTQVSCRQERLVPEQVCLVNEDWEPLINPCRFWVWFASPLRSGRTGYSALRS